MKENIFSHGCPSRSVEEHYADKIDSKHDRSAAEEAEGMTYVRRFSMRTSALSRDASAWRANSETRGMSRAVGSWWWQCWKGRHVMG